MFFDLLWSYSTLTFNMYFYFDLLSPGWRLWVVMGRAWVHLCICSVLGLLCSFGSVSYAAHVHKLVMRTVVNKREGLPVGNKDYFYPFFFLSFLSCMLFRRSVYLNWQAVTLFLMHMFLKLWIQIMSPKGAMCSFSTKKKSWDMWSSPQSRWKELGWNSCRNHVHGCDC